MKFRSGSALLIVLGMMAFMVISGVAFSVYMRATRLPSSFTRRTVATRQLAKAALTEAIDQIDRSIANDPHPNVRGNTENEYNNNAWLGRVLFTPYVETDKDGNETLQKPSQIISEVISDKSEGGCADTVPVLTLEALAYLPIPLVNEARYYGQRTPTAAWQTFDFDAGRYAYIALDVSDYFDVNRLVANYSRSSNPARRVTFGYAFDDADHCKWDGGADRWDSFREEYAKFNKEQGTFSFGTEPPLVSLADFNYVFHTKFSDTGLQGMTSPFYQYLNSSDKGFYRSSPENEESDFWKYAQMTFVTDSLDAPIPESEKKTDAGKTILNLDDDQNKIFTEAFLDSSQDNRPLLSITGLKTEPFQSLISDRVPFVTMFNLSDYLDCDRVPISLGVPSVERVPMICGIKPLLGASKVKVTMETKAITAVPTAAPGENDPTTKDVEYEYYWRLDAQSLAAGFMGGFIQTLVVYPFLNHEKASEENAFRLDGKVQLFLSSATMRLRTGNSDDLLHWGGSGGSNAESPGSAQLQDNAVLTLPLEAENLTLQQTVTEPSKCVQQLNLNLSSSASKITTELANDKGDILKAKYKWTVSWNTTSGKWEPNYPGDGTVPPAEAVQEASSALRPLQKDGTVDTDFSADMKSKVAGLDKTLQLNMAVTLRVISSDSAILGESGPKTVDMVPATLYDDKPLNNVDNSMGLAAGVFSSLTGEATPLMKFDTGVSFPVKFDKTATCDSDVKLTVANGKSASIMVDDPRWNHAPENWKVLDDFSAEGWLAATTAAARDGDIFMATSDQGYLQSVYEFAFLPRCSTLKDRGDATCGDLPGYPSADGSWENLCAKNPIDADFMWKTYDIFGRYSDGGDDFEGLALDNLSRGLRVNPYSDSTNVIMAAFANTPLDWRAASENEDTTLNPAAAASDAKTFNETYAWNEYSSGGKISWPALSAVAGEFMANVRVRALSGGDWRDALVDIFDKPQTLDTEDYLCGLDLKLAEFKPEEGSNSKIYSVDKKFLYGFWRNSFAARQQLFLVFFRAEPMMLGGGVAGEIPPQLGARGVALVWRNPNKTGTGNGYASFNQESRKAELSTSYIPHQTRVLFYRQFE